MIRCADDCLNVTADVKVSLNINGHGIARAHEVFEYSIDDVFVENFDRAKCVDIELERFELDTKLTGNVVELDRREVGEVGERTDRGELRAFERNSYFFAFVLIFKRVELGKVHRVVGSFLNDQSRVL